MLGLSGGGGVNMQDERGSGMLLLNCRFKLSVFSFQLHKEGIYICTYITIGLSREYLISICYHIYSTFGVRTLLVHTVH